MTAEEKDEVVRRLLWVMHLSFVQIRNLTYGSQATPETLAQINELCDVMENAPELILNFAPNHRENLVSEIKRYKERYPSAYPLLEFLEGAYPLSGNYGRPTTDDMPLRLFEPAPSDSNC